MKYFIYLSLILQIGLLPLMAEEVLENQELSLDSLLNIKVSVASKKMLTPRESPGIVTVVTRDEIQNSGARDLVDVLRLIPGFEFAVDVQGMTGMGIRGIWGYEGKILLMLDGQELNEPLYSTAQVGNRIPIDSIQQIEVIRGPGSAIYGGYAELAVINLITRSAEGLKKPAASATYGQMGYIPGRKILSGSYGYTSGDFSISTHLHAGQTVRSNKIYTDSASTSFDMSSNSAINPFNLNTQVKFKDLSARLIYENYSTSYRDAFTLSVPNSFNRPVVQNFYGIFGEVKYDAKVLSHLTLTPKLIYKNQLPYNTVGAYNQSISNFGSDFSAVIYNKQVQRGTANLSLNWDYFENINIVSGIESYIDQANDYNGNSFANGINQIKYFNTSGFAQLLWNNPWINLTLGARYDQHSAFGSAFVPRIAFTKLIDRFHFKVLASQAFRAPSIENMALNSTIKPERTTALELELGYQLNSNMFLSANIFDTTIYQPIVYDATNGVESYQNFSKTGTRGFEMIYKILDRWGSFDLTYSYYDQALKNEVALYALTNTNLGSSSASEHALLGFSPHKLSLKSTFNFSNNIHLTPSLIYLSEKYDANIGKIEGNFLLNAYVLFKNVGLASLDLGMGLYNLLDQNYVYVQPYASGHYPLPGSGRELAFKISYGM